MQFHYHHDAFCAPDRSVLGRKLEMSQSEPSATFGAHFYVSSHKMDGWSTGLMGHIVGQTQPKWRCVPTKLLMSMVFLFLLLAFPAFGVLSSLVLQIAHRRSRRRFPRFSRSSTVNECLVWIARIEFAAPFSVRKGFAPSALLIGFPVRKRFHCQFGSRRT